MTRPRVPLEERLWKNVDIRGKDECWPWLRAVTKEGYGRIAAGAGSKAVLKTHRVVWIVTFGEIPFGWQVCHQCDNPPCCNPFHLFLGSELVNNRDMIQKGRDGGWAAENRLRTHCIRGHELSGNNLYVRPDGKRQCRKCAAIHDLNRNRKDK